MRFVALLGSLDRSFPNEVTARLRFHMRKAWRCELDDRSRSYLERGHPTPSWKIQSIVESCLSRTPESYNNIRTTGTKSTNSFIQTVSICPTGRPRKRQLYSTTPRARSDATPSSNSLNSNALPLPAYQELCRSGYKQSDVDVRILVKARCKI